MSKIINKRYLWFCVYMNLVKCVPGRLIDLNLKGCQILEGSTRDRLKIEVFPDAKNESTQPVRLQAILEKQNSNLFHGIQVSRYEDLKTVISTNLRRFDFIICLMWEQKGVIPSKRACIYSDCEQLYRFILPQDISERVVWINRFLNSLRSFNPGKEESIDVWRSLLQEAAGQQLWKEPEPRTVEIIKEKLVEVKPDEVTQATIKALESLTMATQQIRSEIGTALTGKLAELLESLKTMTTQQVRSEIGAALTKESAELLESLKTMNQQIRSEIGTALTGKLAELLESLKTMTTQQVRSEIGAALTQELAELYRLLAQCPIAVTVQNDQTAMSKPEGVAKVPVQIQPISATAGSMTDTKVELPEPKSAPVGIKPVTPQSSKTNSKPVQSEGIKAKVDVKPEPALLPDESIPTKPARQAAELQRKQGSAQITKAEPEVVAAYIKAAEIQEAPRQVGVSVASEAAKVAPVATMSKDKSALLMEIAKVEANSEGEYGSTPPMSPIEVKSDNSDSQSDQWTLIPHPEE